MSCVELDAAVEIAQRIGPEGGVFGCRMTGGGFGGCAVALIETAAQQGIVRDIRANYLEPHRHRGDSSFCRARAGARVWSSSKHVA